MIKQHKIVWTGGEIIIDELGCKMMPIFNLNNKKIKPLHEPTWLDDTTEEFNSLPGILQNLKGEFPCVPFGINSHVEELKEEWKSSYSEEPYVVNEPHGFSSNNNWDLIDLQSHHAEFQIIYPEKDLVNFLKRKISVSDDEPNKISCTLQINVKEDCELPIGLHPMLRIPDDFNKLKIKIGSFKFGLNYPGLVLRDKTLGAIGEEFSSLDNVRGYTSQTIDLSKPPFKGNFEDLFQLCGVNGNVSIDNLEDNYQFNYQWDPSHFNSVLMWVSNKGRTEYPWDSKHTTIGFEPITSAFGLSTHVSTNHENPISKRNIPTTIKLYKDKPLQTNYSFSIKPL